MPRFARAWGRCCFWTTASALLILGISLNLTSLRSVVAADSPSQKQAADAAPDYKDSLPRIAPKSPAEALKTFTVHPGFHLEQVAVEPLVRSPVAMEFDENGRLYVVEMIDYSEQDKDFLGEIRLLEDTDGDGKFDKSIAFAEKLSWPTALFCYDGGLFVGAAPHIYYLKDTNGDGKADIRKLVYTGFNRNNVQGMLNSFRWGLDNRIHGATGTSGGTITRPDVKSSRPVNLFGRDFAINPKNGEMIPTSGGAQHGMSFDDWGNKFACSNSDHIQLVMFEDRYIARNPYLPAPSSRMSIAADGPQAEVFRISPVEPWRVIRTKLRVQGLVQGSVEGGGRAAGYFTGATGTTIYRGNAFPVEYHGQAFVGDVGSNIVHRKTVKAKGVGFVADRADAGKEFVASTDTWFRPAQFANAPDGTLYIADVYREVIEHPASIPIEIKKYLDLTSGRDKGRIYRVVPDGFKQPAIPRMGSAATADLVAFLEHPNAWNRETASRLLYTRQDASVVPALRELAKSSKSPLGRMHALATLQGLGGLNAEVLAPALSDESPRVREHAVKLAEPFATTSSELTQRLCAMVNDPDVRVRYQLAFTLGETSAPERLAALSKILQQDSDNEWIRLAVLSSLARDAEFVFNTLAVNSKFRAGTTGKAILSQLAGQIGQQAQPQAVAAVLEGIQTLPDQDQSLAALLVGRLSTGLSRTRSPLLAKINGRNAELLKNSVKQALDSSVAGGSSMPLRLDAIRTLRLGQFGELRDTFSQLLTQTQPREVQQETLSTLGSFSDPGVADVIVSAWKGLSPYVRRSATETLFSRPAWLVSFLTAVEQEKIPRGDLDMGRLPQIRTHADPQVRAKRNGPRKTGQA